jgi:uncharacterized protein YrzB (UPF0473 family)
LNDESGNEDIQRKVEKLTVYDVSKKHVLPTFTGKTEDQTEYNVCRKSDDEGANGHWQLEVCEYKVVPDVLETDGGTWELISKVQHRNHSLFVTPH